MNNDQPMLGDIVAYNDDENHPTATIVGVIGDGERFLLRFEDGRTIDVGDQCFSVLPEQNVLMLAYLRAIYLTLKRGPDEILPGDLFWHRETVRLALADPEATAFDFHTSWYDRHRAMGWHFGRFFNESAKRHPAVVPFDKLTDKERAAEVEGEKVLHSAIKAMGVNAYLPV